MSLIRKTFQIIPAQIMNAKRIYRTQIENHMLAAAAVDLIVAMQMLDLIAIQIRIQFQ